LFTYLMGLFLMTKLHYVKIQSLSLAEKTHCVFRGERNVRFFTAGHQRVKKRAIGFGQKCTIL